MEVIIVLERKRNVPSPGCYCLCVLLKLQPPHLFMTCQTSLQRCQRVGINQNYSLILLICVALTSHVKRFSLAVCRFIIPIYMSSASLLSLTLNLRMRSDPCEAAVWCRSSTHGPPTPRYFTLTTCSW